MRRSRSRIRCMQGTPVVAATIVLCALAAGAGVPANLLEQGTKLYSQHDEELIIRHFFDDRRDGVFVDVGSFHWWIMSTTYYLEEKLGWSGIAVDALPGLAPGYRENRPRTKFFQYIVTDHSGTTETLYVAGSLSSTLAEHIENFPEHADLQGGPVEVHTTTLNELLEREGVEKIDFLSMDIEAGEPTALAGFDIDRYRPELVCIEASRTVRDAISTYFDEHGYERIDFYLSYDPANWYYRPKAPRSGRILSSVVLGSLLLSGVWWFQHRRVGGAVAPRRTV